MDLIRETSMKRSTPSRKWHSDWERKTYFMHRACRRRIAGDVCEARWHPSCPALIESERDRIETNATTWHHAHHVHERRHGGDNEISNLRWVCEHCHNRIHNRRDEAIARGLLLDPRTIRSAPTIPEQPSPDRPTIDASTPAWVNTPDPF